MNLPWIESPFFEYTLKNKRLSEEEIKLCRDYNSNGFVVIKNVINPETADKIIAEIDRFFPDNIDLELNRNQDLWQSVVEVKDLACNDKIITILKLLYERDPIPFQTLNFKYGSQQKTHSDSIHFSSIPERFMCGVWVALEETSEDNGPLIYYPKSHKEKQYNYFDIGIPIDNPGDGDGLKKGGGYNNYSDYENFIEELIRAKNLEFKELHLKKGDALIWASNLLHGGKQVIDSKLTRWSQVTHYYFEDCLYLTPMWSNMATGELFLRNPNNILKNEPINPTLNGKKTYHLFTGNSRYFCQEKFEPSLLKDYSWKQISVLLKDKIKRQISKG
ncbi:MAG: phytanoyl-CoA dioxygenase family protein [Bacteroidota bacterium]